MGRMNNGRFGGGISRRLFAFGFSAASFAKDGEIMQAAGESAISFKKNSHPIG